jgi:hypothetical protein
MKILGLLAVATLVAAHVGATAAFAQEDPALILQQFQDGRNRGDVRQAMSLVAADVTYVDGSACPLESPCVGTDRVRREIQAFVFDDGYSYTIGVPEVSGTTIHARLASESTARSAIGISLTMSDVSAEVRDGQVISWRTVSDLTDDQTVWWLDHQPVP